VRSALIVYFFSSGIVVLGIMFGYEYVQMMQAPDIVCGAIDGGDIWDAFATWDGRYYKSIVESGYTWKPGTLSNISFFPAYPLLAQPLMFLPGLRAEAALLIVSHLCLFASLVVFSAYLDIEGEGSALRNKYALLALAILPTAFFFRIAYSESFFLLTLLLALYGMKRYWHTWIIVLISGLSSGTRPVGVGLLLPLAFYLHNSASSGWKSVFKYFWLVPACWGLAGFMLFQWCEFGNAFAFVESLPRWNFRTSPSFWEKVLDLCTFEPIGSLIEPGSPYIWFRWAGEWNPIFSLVLANPIYWLGTGILIFLGWCKGWLLRYEILLSIPLLIIPYYFRAYEMSMGSLGRYAGVVFPVYIVIGRLMEKGSTELAISIFCCSAFLLGIYAALFAAGYQFF